jgi:GTPase
LSLKHEHEYKSGTTSDIKREFIGFNKDKLINYYTGLDGNMENIYIKSDRYVTLDDLPGNGKYLKSTLYGLLSGKNNGTVVCIPGDNGKSVIDESLNIYKGVIKLCTVRKSEILILITKTDLIDDAKLGELIEYTKTKLFKNRTIPDNVNILSISSISKKGKSDLIDYISKLSMKNAMNTPSVYSETDDVIFVTNEVFSNPSVETILYGYVKCGKIKIGDELNIVCNGQIYKRKVKSIHKKKIEATQIFARETGCIQFSNSTGLNLRKSTVVISDSMVKNHVDEISFIGYGKSIPKEKDYVMFNGSTIQTISLCYEMARDGILIVKIKGHKKMFIEPDSVTILKDETQSIIVGCANN